MRLGSQAQHAVPTQPPSRRHGSNVGGSIHVPGTNQNNRSAKIKYRGFDVNVHAASLNRASSSGLSGSCSCIQNGKLSARKRRKESVVPGARSCFMKVLTRTAFPNSVPVCPTHNLKRGMVRGQNSCLWDQTHQGLEGRPPNVSPHRKGWELLSILIERRRRATPIGAAPLGQWKRLARTPPGPLSISSFGNPRSP